MTNTMVNKTPPTIFESIDLLHKSFMEVCDGGEKVESQSKAFSAVSVSAAKNAKSFEDSQDVFHADAS